MVSRVMPCSLAQGKASIKNLKMAVISSLATASRMMSAIAATKIVNMMDAIMLISMFCWGKN